MNNVRVGTLTRQLTGHSFRYDEEWLRSRAPDRSPSHCRCSMAISLPTRCITTLITCCPTARRSATGSSGAIRRARSSRSICWPKSGGIAGAVTLLPPGKRRTEGLRWQTLDEAQLTALLTAYQSDIPSDDYRPTISVSRWPAPRKRRCCGWASSGVFRRAPRRPRISLSCPSAR